MGEPQEVKRAGFLSPRTPPSPGLTAKRQDARFLLGHRQSTAREAVANRLQEPARFVRVLGADDKVIRIPKERGIARQSREHPLDAPSIEHVMQEDVNKDGGHRYLLAESLAPCPDRRLPPARRLSATAR